MEPNVLYHQALKKWGKESQLVIAMEECAELQMACSKLFRGRKSNIAEEIIDVEICLGQLKLLIKSPQTLKRWRQIKLKRLERRLK